MTVHVRPAQRGDTAAIVAMIHQLADFENAAELCSVTETQLDIALFGDPVTVRAHVALVDDEVAAVALWFLNFSTWDGVAGLHLEDLYVRPPFRRRGLGRALLAVLARHCVDHGYTRLSWAVLNWNTDAIALYDAVGGQPQREWTSYRLSGPELVGLAASG